jgi:hypothetical protein
LNRFHALNHFDFNYFDLLLLLVIRILNCFAHNGFAVKKSLACAMPCGLAGAGQASQ